MGTTTAREAGEPFPREADCTPLPTKLTLSDCAYFFDGGSLILFCSDEYGKPHEVMLVQSMFKKINEPCGWIPGRLYFDDEIVPVGSARESELVGLLRRSGIRLRPGSVSRDADAPTVTPGALILGNEIKEVMSRSPDEHVRKSVLQIIERVGSREYVVLAAEVDRINDIQS